MCVCVCVCLWGPVLPPRFNGSVAEVAAARWQAQVDGISQSDGDLNDDDDDGGHFSFFGKPQNPL